MKYKIELNKTHKHYEEDSTFYG